MRMRGRMKKNQSAKHHFHSVSHSDFVPGAGIEPARPKAQDFESSASTSSATRAFGIGTANLHK